MLRAVVLKNQDKLQMGEYIFVAKGDLLEKDFKTLNKDFTYAMKKMEKF
jgi:ribonuclease P protein component